MSETELQSKPSVRGYANFLELRSLLVTVLATNGLIGVALQVLIDLASQYQVWLHAPWASAVMPLVVMALTAIQAKFMTKKILAQGR